MRIERNTTVQNLDEGSAFPEEKKQIVPDDLFYRDSFEKGADRNLRVGAKQKPFVEQSETMEFKLHAPSTRVDNWWEGFAPAMDLISQPVISNVPMDDAMKPILGKILLEAPHLLLKI